MSYRDNNFQSGCTKTHTNSVKYTVNGIELDDHICEAIWTYENLLKSSFTYDTSKKLDIKEIKSKHFKYNDKPNYYFTIKRDTSGTPTHTLQNDNNNDNKPITKTSNESYDERYNIEMTE
jgi:hypothetical protein